MGEHLLLPSIRRLALADLEEETLRQLVVHGESIYVERKVELPQSPRFGAAAASFANFLGGFVLVGVDDDGDVVGWEKPGRADLQAHFGEILRDEVDPLPPFIADTRELDGKTIGVLRVFESADQPHVVRGTGAIYVRTSKGKEPVPVDDHRTILAMARRGEEAGKDARERLANTPAVGLTLGTPDSIPPDVARADFRGVEFVARAAPLTVIPAVGDWPLTRRAAEHCAAEAEKLLPPFRVSGFDFGRAGPMLHPHGRGVAAKVQQNHGGGRVDQVQVIVDSNGVFAAGLQRGTEDDDPPSFLIDRILDEELRPLAGTMASLLDSAEAYGRTVVDLWIMLGPGGKVYGGAQSLRRRRLHVSRELTVPAEPDEVEELAQQWHREVQREVGIERYEPTRPAS